MPTAVATAQLPTGVPGLYAPDYGTLITQATALNQALGQNLGSQGSGSGKPDRGRQRPEREEPKPKPPTARQRASLRFSPDPAITARVDRAFAAGFGAPGVDVDVVIADLTRLRELATADLKRFGWRATDLGDIAAYVLIGAFLRLRDDVEGRVAPRHAAAVRRGVRDALAVQPSVRRLTDARQQELAETLLLRIAYSVAHLNTLTDHGDDDGAAAVREQLRSFIEEIYGIDPTRARLGPRGFVPGRD